MDCQELPVPYMHVGKVRGRALVANFLEKKHGPLSEHIKKQEALSQLIMAEAFIGLIAAIKGANAYGVRIHLANYIRTGILELDQEIDNASSMGQMTVVIAPTDGNLADLPSYFAISPKGWVIPIGELVATRMWESFRGEKRRVLTDIGVQDRGAGFLETISLWAALANFDDAPGGLVKEIKCQRATGIRLYFGAYDKDDFCQDKSVGWQMTIVFVLTRAVNIGSSTYEREFEIEDMPGYSNRPKWPSLVGQSIGVYKRFVSFDTLNPCPPASCPPDRRDF